MKFGLVSSIVCTSVYCCGVLVTRPSTPITNVQLPPSAVVIGNEIVPEGVASTDSIMRTWKVKVPPGAMVCCEPGTELVSQGYISKPAGRSESCGMVNVMGLPSVLDRELLLHPVVR